MPRSSILSGTDRYNFLLVLTGYLIANRQQKLSEIAKHFQVTEREVHSAVVTISLSGVGHYRPDELFFLDYDLLEEGIVDLSFAPTLGSVPRLSTRQAAAIASGLVYLRQLVDLDDQSQITELLTILAKGAVGQQGLPFMVQPQKHDSNLAVVRQAIAESRVVSCSYRNSAGELANREIEATSLESREASWYLRGFCRTNNESRIFRVDRMREIRLLDVVTGRQATSTSTGEIYQITDSDTEVLFEVDPGAFSLIADYRPDFEITGTKPVQVKIAIGQLGNLGRIVSRYSGKVRVLAPPKARQLVRDFAAAALGEAAATTEAE